MQQDRSDSSETSRQILNDIAHAERVLLHHAEGRSTGTGDVALAQHAQRLIIYLQQHAQQSQGFLATAKSENPQAHPGRIPSSISEAASDASIAALRTVFDGNLLSELCEILYTLYVSQACLDASPGPLNAPVHAVGHGQMPAPEDCKQAAGNMKLDVTSNSAQHQQHLALPQYLAAAPESPDAHEQAPKDLHETDAIRCAPSYCPRSLCSTWQKLSVQHVIHDLTS